MIAQPIKVLLVEDNPTDVLLVRATLKAVPGLQFELATADYLATGIQRAKDELFDVVLLDLGLPGSHGLETFESFHAAVPEVPIVILSGLGDEEVAMRAVQHGGQDYLPKAEAMDDALPRAIRYAIERHRAQLEREHFAAELQQRNELLEEELRMAREIQCALLTHKYPEFIVHDRSALHFAHCYRPAVSLSGDFFSVLRLSDNKAGVLICDVMGHGVQAALIGTLMRGLMRGLVDQFKTVATEPGKFLSALNQQISETFKQAGIDTFATAFYFIADLANQQVHYANAGHPSAMILRRDAHVVDWLGVGGQNRPPLGLLGGTIYPTFHEALAPHDAILLFTDGLYEAENDAGEPYGRERLIAAVRQRLHEPCDQLLDELIHASQEFSGHEDFGDDVCILGMDVVNGVAAVHDDAA
jgi:sigma-B regulation protein RsbU (phosphoserine phosphatase)